MTTLASAVQDGDGTAVPPKISAERRADVYVAVRHQGRDLAEVAETYGISPQLAEKIASGHRPVRVSTPDPQVVRLAAEGAVLDEIGQYLGVSGQAALNYLRRFEIARGPRPPEPRRPARFAVTQPSRQGLRDAAMVAQLKDFVAEHGHPPSADAEGLGKWLARRRHYRSRISEELRAAIADAGVDLDIPGTPGTRYSEICQICCDNRWGKGNRTLLGNGIYIKHGEAARK